MERIKKTVVGIAGLNIMLALCLAISVATATIQLSNYPNPFSPKKASTTIAFYVFDEAVVEAKIYDLMGRDVKTLSSGSFPSGEYKIQWDGKNELGERVSRGGYILRLTIRYSSGKVENAVRKIGVL